MSREVPASSETSGGGAVPMAARLAAIALAAGRVNRRVRVSRDMSGGCRVGLYANRLIPAKWRTPRYLSAAPV